jgi:hypothetical protein
MLERYADFVVRADLPSPDFPSSDESSEDWDELGYSIQDMKEFEKISRNLIDDSDDSDDTEEELMNDDEKPQEVAKEIDNQQCLKCDLCGKSFGEKFNLKIHMWIHKIG